MGIQAFTAGEDLVSNRVVGQSVTYIDAATSIPVGVTVSGASSGDLVDLYLTGEVCSVAAGGSITAGDLLKVTTDGKVVSDNTPTSGEWVVGTAVSAGASGGLCVVAYGPYIA